MHLLNGTAKGPTYMQTDRRARFGGLLIGLDQPRKNGGTSGSQGGAVAHLPAGYLRRRAATATAIRAKSAPNGRPCTC